MEKEKFTKEEIETAEKLYELWAKEKYTSPTFKSFLDSLFKPETKKIVVEIEYNDSEFGISAKAIQESISNFDTRNEYVTKVTELPEVFSRQDILEMLKDFLHSDTINAYCDSFISERNK